MYHLERKHNLCKECKVMTSMKYKDNAAYFCNSLAHIAITQTTNASNIMRLNYKEAHSNNINKTKTKKNYYMSLVKGGREKKNISHRPCFKKEHENWIHGSQV